MRSTKIAGATSAPAASTTPSPGSTSSSTTRRKRASSNGSTRILVACDFDPQHHHSIINAVLHFSSTSTTASSSNDKYNNNDNCCRNGGRSGDSGSAGIPSLPAIKAALGAALLPHMRLQCVPRQDRRCGPVRWEQPAPHHCEPPCDTDATTTANTSTCSSPSTRAKGGGGFSMDDMVFEEHLIVDDTAAAVGAAADSANNTMTRNRDTSNDEEEMAEGKKEEEGFVQSDERLQLPDQQVQRLALNQARLVARLRERVDDIVNHPLRTARRGLPWWEVHYLTAATATISSSTRSSGDSDHCLLSDGTVIRTHNVTNTSSNVHHHQHHHHHHQVHHSVPAAPTAAVAAKACVVVIRIHHALGDGLSLVRVLAEAFTTRIPIFTPTCSSNTTTDCAIAPTDATPTDTTTTTTTTTNSTATTIVEERLSDVIARTTTSAVPRRSGLKSSHCNSSNSNFRASPSGWLQWPSSVLRLVSRPVWLLFDGVVDGCGLVVACGRVLKGLYGGRDTDCVFQTDASRRRPQPITQQRQRQPRGEGIRRQQQQLPQQHELQEKDALSADEIALMAEQRFAVYFKPFSVATVKQLCAAAQHKYFSSAADVASSSSCCSSSGKITINDMTFALFAGAIRRFNQQRDEDVEQEANAAAGPNPKENGSTSRVTNTTNPNPSYCRIQALTPFGIPEQPDPATHHTTTLRNLWAFVVNRLPCDTPTLEGRIREAHMSWTRIKGNYNQNSGSLHSKDHENQMHMSGNSKIENNNNNNGIFSTLLGVVSSTLSRIAFLKKNNTSSGVSRRLCALWSRLCGSRHLVKASFGLHRLAAMCFPYYIQYILYWQATQRNSLVFSNVPGPTQHAAFLAGCRVQEVAVVYPNLCHQLHIVSLDGRLFMTCTMALPTAAAAAPVAAFATTTSAPPQSAGEVAMEAIRSRRRAYSAAFVACWEQELQHAVAELLGE